MAYTEEKAKEIIAKELEVSMDQLTHNASQAMARVDSLDLSGQKTPIGLAFSLEDGLVATACKGIGPMSQLSLYMAPRTVPVPFTA